MYSLAWLHVCHFYYFRDNFNLLQTIFAGSFISNWQTFTSSYTICFYRYMNLPVLYNMCYCYAINAITLSWLLITSIALYEAYIYKASNFEISVLINILVIMHSKEKSPSLSIFFFILFLRSLYQMKVTKSYRLSF